MATTSSTGATPTPTPSTTSVTKSAASALFSSLNTGSGVDTDALVKGLVEAQFAAKTAAITARSTKLTAQLSGVSTLKSQITDFAAAFETLVKSGSLQAQPASSNGAVLGVTALAGAKLTGLTASVRVNRLASAQTATSNASVASKDAVIGGGTLTLKIGTGSYDGGGALTGVTAPDADSDGQEDTVAIAIPTDASLAQIAAAINAKKTGVTASVVTDAGGAAYLSLKGTTGAAQAFTLTATNDPTGNLAQFAVGPGAAGTTIGGRAANASITLDGVTVERATNSVSDLIDGVKLDLNAVSATAVTLSATTSTTALTNAVEDFVFTYNQVMGELKKQTDPISGDLRGDPGAQNLLRSLRGLTLKELLPGAAVGTPKTLAELGVATGRDGTLSVNSDMLATSLKNNPASLEAMFANSSDGSGLLAAMNSLKLNATSTLYGLGASTTRYNQAKGDLTTQQDKLTVAQEKLTTRMTQQFSSMNAKVAAYKSTMTFMENQIKAWTKSD